MAEFQQNVYLLIATCEKTNFDYAIPLQNSKTQTMQRVVCLRDPSSKVSIEQDTALTSLVIRVFFIILI